MAMKHYPAEYRTRAWKTELAALAAETGLDITVCHMPPGTQCRCLITGLCPCVA